MKTPSKVQVSDTAPSPSSDSGKKKGIALLTVLTVTALSTILVLTFFSLAQNELVSSTRYSQGIEARQFAETAVNMVVGQIRKATGRDVLGSQDIFAWASQPGAIRQYDQDGEFHAGYKLYSDDEMITATETALTKADITELREWNDAPWRWVDLNEPIVRGDQVYFPIADPTAKLIQKVEGFDFNNTLIGASPMQTLLQQKRSDALPMPVVWIYQLQDGTMGTMSFGKKFVPLVSSAPSPTEENPIVGRFAFWTDDESCKLNVNVHAGGAAWDTPRASGDIDRALGRYQPAQHEWQRYPGHPATTHLSPVLFPGLVNLGLNRAEIEKIYKLVPRIVGGGSTAGTRKVNPNDPKEANGLIADKDRLYPSMDEFIMAMDRKENEFPTSDSIPSEVLERSRFFLTTSSRAPEVTLFNTPRIVMWPTYFKTNTSGTQEAFTTAYDKLIRFCGEVGKISQQNKAKYSGYPERYQYYFQRISADSPTADFEGDSEVNPEGIIRNRELYAYLDWLTSTDIPGIGDKFSNKYSDEDRYATLTQIFDYIRSTNLFDDTLYEDFRDAFSKTNTDEHLTFTNLRWQGGNDRGMHPGHGQVTPIEIEYKGVDTRGHGRFYTLSEVAIHLIACAEGNGKPGGVRVEDFPSNYPRYTGPYWDSDDPGWDSDAIEEAKKPENWNYALEPGQPLGNNQTLVQAAMLFQLFSPSLGWIPINPDMKFKINVEGFSVGGNSLTWGQGSGGSEIVFPANRNGLSFTWAGRNSGGYVDFRALLRGTKDNGDINYPAYNGKVPGEVADDHKVTRVAKLGFGAFTGSYDGGKSSPGPDIYYPWISQPEVVSGSNMSVGGGTVTVDIFAGGGMESGHETDPKVVQHFEIDFPDFSSPKPELARGTAERWNDEKTVLVDAQSIAPEWWIFNADGCNVGNNHRGRLKGAHKSTTSPNYNDTGDERWRSGQFRGSFIREGDVVRSMVVAGSDPRLIMGLKEVEGGATGPHFVPHADYNKNEPFAHSLSDSVRGMSHPGSGGKSNYKKDYEDADFQLVRDVKLDGNRRPYFARADGYESSVVQKYGDFDNAWGNLPSGPFINKPDEGNTHALLHSTDPNSGWQFLRDYGDFPYFVRDWVHEPQGPSYFSPNRILRSPAQFGSLPSGMASFKPFQTLLFRPNVEGGIYTTHPGAESPPDHLLMDFFWMPVVEPFAISEPFSTAGKVNLNYQILPFTHITRNTALRGVFRSEYMLCVPNRWSNSFKVGVGRGRGYHWLNNPFGGDLQQKSLRAVIEPVETLSQFEKKFDNDEIFRSASEICEVHLIPQDVGEAQGFPNATGTYTPSVSDMATGKYWSDHALVGDNSRENPYADIYPRVTTKSNTFNVFYRAQVIQKAKGTKPDEWDVNYDQVVAEYRGSTLVERYIEPEGLLDDANDPDYGTEFNKYENHDIPGLDELYKFRVVSTRRFAP